ncbi:rRNA-processing protein UTP22 [Spizellomyces punctatus DAOM BR117]|uniref:U3 small nucleolar RNA-associated protein 22 n=1 Tax=Spizellomyces punctatus (strain DAOM BR117) TaxID=645134 RepID=A0A0L0HNC0_SPIPD|nr:rRNA-processing protein UTP22 [Spizellomyces punctatus DAOM BR117]KND02445.1 hypothetical protein SPPG_02910 [Spizellomyces punctatus DAOM BR117]|eukprot:XP_016610484.1 hypothetical protein SPPG_02910 [Spizellomyces punctatus DAOM BR117]
MVAVKRKGVPTDSRDSTSAKKRSTIQHDPYIDPSDDDDDSDADGGVEEEVNGGDFVEGSESDESEGEASEYGEDQADDKEVGHGQRLEKIGNKFYKAPTNEEIQQLKETTDLFKSNLFKLQIDELLKEVRIDYSKTTALEKALRKIKDILDSLSDIPEVSVADGTSGLQSENIVIPFPDPAPPADAQYKFAFKRPSKVFVVGSYLLKTVAKNPSGANVDLAVQMPESLFQEKDHVNYRYFYKRAYYIAVLAAELRKKTAKLGLTLEFEACQGDRRRPILVLRSTGTVPEYDFSKLGFCIRLFATIPQTLFSASRLAPNRNNVRPTFISATTSDHTPTGRYNAALLHDTTLVAHMNLLHHHATTCGSFRDACILAKVWLTQRAFSSTEGGFNGFLFAMIMGYLLRTNDKNGNRRLGNNFSSYQLLKVTMEFLATHDFEAEPVFMTPDGKPLAENDFSVESFTRNYEVVIVDPSGKINLAAAISRATLDEVQYEARRSISLFSDLRDDHFAALFLKKVDLLHLRYDNVARIAATSTRPKSYDTAVALDFPSVQDYLLNFIPRLLKRALTNRVNLVCARCDALPPWSCDQAAPTHESLGTPIYLGLILDTENAVRVVEHGPSADDIDAAEEFRQLWGEKSELRRFKDGSILESVVFDCDGTIEQRSLVVGRMVGHLLHRHTGITPKDELTYWAGQFNKFIRAPGIQLQVRSFQGAMDAFNEFSKHLRQLEGLPLTVTQTIPCAEGLRYTSVFIPQPRMDDEEASSEAYRPYYEPLDVVIEFESSGRWPDDLAAIQLTKRAFYLKIAELYMQQHPGTRGIVSTGHNADILDSGCIEITTAAGYTFRCTIHVEREAILLERGLTSNALPSTLETYTAAQKRYNHSFIRAPFHSTRLQNLCLRFPYLPQSIRLTKRWLGAHLLSSQIPTELIELICAKVFVDPSPWAEPGSGWVGFMRTLDLLAKWDWKREVMIVELEKGLITAEMRAKIAESFRTTRGLGADGTLLQGSGKMMPVLWVATERDAEGQWWASEKPSIVVVERIKRLAAAGLNYMESLVKSSGSEKALSKIFLAAPKGYDLIIRLDPSKLPRFRESLSYDPEILAETMPKYKNLMMVKDRELALLSEIDPVQWYLDELQAAFGHVALFFHDKYGGDAIGVVWNPKTVVPHPWRVNLSFNVEPILDQSANGAPVKGKKQGKKHWTVKPNFLAMMAEMERLGGELVAGVDVFTHLA